MERKHRLTRRQDFSKVYRIGKSAANHQFVVYYLPRQGQSEYRLGISVSKKVGNAVVRNRIRRLVKEIVRLNGELVLPNCDLILIARKPAAEMDYAEMEKSIKHVLKRASLIVPKPKQAERGRGTAKTGGEKVE